MEETQRSCHRKSLNQTKRALYLNVLPSQKISVCHARRFIYAAIEWKSYRMKHVKMRDTLLVRIDAMQQHEFHSRFVSWKPQSSAFEGSLDKTRREMNRPSRRTICFNEALLRISWHAQRSCVINNTSLKPLLKHHDCNALRIDFLFTMDIAQSSQRSRM